jgi:hypothetical protein
MGIKAGMTCLLATIVVLILVPAASASRWVVKDNHGDPAGSVVDGLNDAGSPCGWLRSGGHVVANVYRVAQAGFDGWMVSPGVNETPKDYWVLRRSCTRFTLGTVGNDHPRARATRTAAGYWVLSRRSSDGWRRAGSVRGGCKGAWAAGAAGELL